MRLTDGHSSTIEGLALNGGGTDYLGTKCTCGWYSGVFISLGGLSPESAQEILVKSFEDHVKQFNGFDTISRTH